MSRAATMMDSTASIAVGSPNSRTARSTASGATGTALPGRLAPCVTVTLQSLSAPAWMVTLMPAGSFFARLTAGRGVAAGAAVVVGTGAGAGCARGFGRTGSTSGSIRGSDSTTGLGRGAGLAGAAEDAVYAQFLCLERQFVVDAFGADHHGVAVHRHDFRRGTGFDPQAGSRLAQIDGGALAFGDSRGERCQIVRSEVIRR